jgi:hypothetical protein
LEIGTQTIDVTMYPEVSTPSLDTFLSEISDAKQEILTISEK